MKPSLATYIAGLIAALPLGLSAKEVVPPNVTVRDGRVLDKIDWSFSPDRSVNFAKLKRCVAVNLTNDEIILKDSATPLAGILAANSLPKTNTTAIAGRDIFKMIDEENKFLVAQGWIDKPVFAFRWILRFDLEVALEDSKVKMVMRNIKLAMSNTGSGSNNGFNDVGISYRFKQNYATLESEATQIKTCITE